MDMGGFPRYDGARPQRLVRFLFAARYVLRVSQQRLERNQQRQPSL